MKQEIADEALESKWNELNLGIDQWKHKYLYPFGQIAPIENSKGGASTAAGSSVNIGSVNQSHISTVSTQDDDHLLTIALMVLLDVGCEAGSSKLARVRHVRPAEVIGLDLLGGIGGEQDVWC